MAKRIFKHSPNGMRCEYTIRIGPAKDDLQQCGRYKKIGSLCTQHTKIVAKMPK